MNWNNITLGKFQQIEEINSRNLSDIDRVLFSACIVFDKTEFELDNAEPKKVLNLTNRLTKIFEKPINPLPYKKIGKYFVNYDISKITFGQYIELAFFLNQPIKNAHYVLATLSNQWLRRNKVSDHRKKANYFLDQPVTKIIGTLQKIGESIHSFNDEYKSLFGLDKAVTGDVEEDRFNKRYGWIYSAEQVAKYEGKSMEDTFSLPVRQAFNDLTYLKAKAKYEMEQFKKNNKSIA